MRHPIRSLMRNLSDRFASPYMAELHGRVDETQTALIDLGRELTAVRQLLDRLQSLPDGLALANEVLRRVYEEDAAQRRRLYELRRHPEYELAFTESEPLVSFVVPTFTRFETLRDVCLPSILSQTYSNVEVIVAGDSSPPETGEVIAELDDPRVRFHNRSVRGPYPDDASVRWYMIGTPPYNDGVSLARGRWIAALGDDDAVRPDHTEVLVRAAQERRHELCYGRHVVHYPNGEELEVGSFPPSKGEFVLQTSLYHSGLAFFQMEPVDYLYEDPNDWSLCRRMLAAGVRFGMVEDILADKYESRYHSHSDWGAYGVPSVE
jgi:Glycosyl transferase family 2